MCILKTSLVNQTNNRHINIFSLSSTHFLSLQQHTFAFPPRKSPFSMKVLVMPLSSLYKNPLQPSPFSTPNHHHHHHNFPIHKNILFFMSISSFKSPPTIFSQSKHYKISSSSMAACVDTSRTATTTTETTTTTTTQKPPLSCNPNDHVYKYMKFCRPSLPDLVSCVPISTDHTKTIRKLRDVDGFDEDEDGEVDLWLKMQDEAKSDVDQEPILSNYYYTSILVHSTIESALANHLSMKLSNSSLPSTTLFDLFKGVLVDDQEIMRAVKEDLRAVKERDPACISFVHCFLNFKGFLACQAHRVAHKLWSQNRRVLALLIQNRVSEVFAVDIHPGAKIGRGILFDHATGVVIGETAVIGNNVSILHNVTLGGTGKASGDRHPKIGDGVLIGAGTCVLGNVRIGEGAKIGAGSVVLKEVPPRTTAVGNPARLIGGKENPIMLDKIPSFTMDHTSHISDWSDYVI